MNSSQLRIELTRRTETRKLIRFLDLALTPKDDSAVDFFAIKLLERLGYDEGDRIVLPQHSIPLMICGTLSRAQTDVCVIDENENLLPLQDKRVTSNCRGHSRVRCEQQNSEVFSRSSLSYEEEITFPAITMIGTSLVFYKIPVTADLSLNVELGMYPATETRVLRYVPKLPRRNSEGMRPLANRVELLKCLQAFKQFLG
jgi:hypothetical protein